MQSLPQRVKSLSKLSSYFPEIWSEVLESTLKIQDHYIQSEILCSLVPHLPEDLVPQAFEATLNNIST